MAVLNHWHSGQTTKLCCIAFLYAYENGQFYLFLYSFAFYIHGEILWTVVLLVYFMLKWCGLQFRWRKSKCCCYHCHHLCNEETILLLKSLCHVLFNFILRAYSEDQKPANPPTHLLWVLLKCLFNTGLSLLSSAVLVLFWIWVCGLYWSLSKSIVDYFFKFRNQGGLFLCMWVLFLFEPFYIWFLKGNFIK